MLKLGMMASAIIGLQGCDMIRNARCSNLVGNWTSGWQSIEVRREGSNFLIFYYPTGRERGFPIRYSGICQGGVIVTDHWDTQYSLRVTGNNAVFAGRTFYKQ